MHMSLLLQALLAAGLVVACTVAEPACHKEHYHHRIVHAGSRCAGALRGVMPRCPGFLYLHNTLEASLTPM